MILGGKTYSTSELIYDIRKEEKLFTYHQKHVPVSSVLIKFSKFEFFEPHLDIIAIDTAFQFSDKNLSKSETSES